MSTPCLPGRESGTPVHTPFASPADVVDETTAAQRRAAKGKHYSSRSLPRLPAPRPSHPPAPHPSTSPRTATPHAHTIPFISPLYPPRSGFLGIVEGLTFENTARGAEEVATAITAALRANADFRRLVMSYRDTLPANFSTQQVLAAVLDSVSVAPLELPAPRVVWRVYMRVTTHTADGYIAIRRAFRDVVFVTPFNNIGHVREDMSCRICRAIDHPTLLCPFPSAPGWMGPTPTSLPLPGPTFAAAGAEIPVDEPSPWRATCQWFLIDKRTCTIYIHEILSYPAVIRLPTPPFAPVVSGVLIAGCHPASHTFHKGDRNSVRVISA
ncbi:hypothetical protein B0H11DRAFT_2288187 [Mycena galericulata]|nr:hypothetical protein B0H11DRAFT_2288187 [Mycena galericulata]